MAEAPERWIIVKFFQHPIQRAEHEIAELKAQNLYVRDASGPDDVHAPVPAGAAATAPAGPPAGGKPDEKEKP